MRASIIILFTHCTGEWNGKDFEVYFSGWDFYDVWQTLDFVNTYTEPIFIAMEIGKVYVLYHSRTQIA